MLEVAIVGAGPAGIAAAIELQRAGVEATIFDKATFPRDKFCGDGLTTAALRLYEALGLDPASVPSWKAVDTVKVASASRRVQTFPLPTGQGMYAAIAERNDLDHAFAKVATSEGATLNEGAAITGVTEYADGVRLDVEGHGSVDARYVIAADGMWSPVRKMLGVSVPGYRGEWHAFRAYFDNVSDAAAEELWVWFEPDVLPGYVWSFPLPGGRANFGFGIQRGAKYDIADMKWVWRDILERDHIREVLGPDATMSAPHRAWPIPARVHSTPLTAHRTFFVGDAAAATDPMTGEGIAQALLTGMHAAHAISGAGPTDAPLATATYRQAVKHDFFTDHAMARLLTRALSHRKGSRIALRLAGYNDWTSRNFARWLFEDYPRALALTPSRWHQGMFTGPGAYRSS